MTDRPNPSVTTVEGGLSNKTYALLVLGTILFVVWIFKTADFSDEEDQREIRQYGGMECVYNIDTDEIEDCVEVRG